MASYAGNSQEALHRRRLNFREGERMVWLRERFVMMREVEVGKLECDVRRREEEVRRRENELGLLEGRLLEKERKIEDEEIRNKVVLGIIFIAVLHCEMIIFCYADLDESGFMDQDETSGVLENER